MTVAEDAIKLSHMHTTPPPEMSNAVSLMLQQGLREQAKILEVKLMAKGMYGGSIATEDELERFITQDEDMMRLKDQIRVLVPLDDSVLIRGETGTGKEHIAKALHGSRGPFTPDKTNLEIGRFVAINCPSLSVDLMFSELFGHVEGAFTGALNDKVGKLQYAYKGTLFIDEIGDMPDAMQSALLRAIQERVICRVGDNKEIKVEFRLVCATHKNLEALVEAGQFREDLYYRISTFELHTKPLRDRRGDIKLILKSLDKKGNVLPEWFEQSVLNGNVRELQRAVKRHNVLGSL
jgi:transcriptional regulator with GAF, ATPase, and Fis domain